MYKCIILMKQLFKSLSCCWMKAHEWFYVASLRITVVSTLLVSLAHAPIKTTETVINRIMSTF
jgi:hypothetical protein